MEREKLNGERDVLMRDVTERLEEVYAPSAARAGAWQLIEVLTGKKRAQLVAADGVVLSDSQQKELRGWLDRIVGKHEPIQYIIGSVPFIDTTVAVRPPVLVPRPETESWVAGLIEKLKTLPNKKLRILDLGAGSGCIAISLAKALPDAEVMATDISDEALKLARENAENNKVANVSFMRSDLFDSLEGEEAFDLIVSNPPYVAEGDWKGLDERITRWEDKGALVAPQEGLAILKRIVEQAPRFLRENEQLARVGIAQLYLEIGSSQGPDVAQEMKQHGYRDVTVTKDLLSRDRIVSGSVAHVDAQTT